VDGPGLIDGPTEIFQDITQFETAPWRDRHLPKAIEPTHKYISADVEKSIAVLPFANVSADVENEYFCDGLAEELINSLSKIEALRVAARTSSFSFKGKNVDIREIGEKLHVGIVLEGSVRKSGSHLRIAAQLISANNGYQIWSEKYDRELEDIFDVQDEIALAIIDALKVKLIGKDKTRVAQRYTDNPEAYELYLKGRFHLNKWTADGLDRAIECFSSAVELDPKFAQAFSGLADCYSSLSMEATGVSPAESAPKAKDAVFKALALDDSLAEAHTSLGLIKMTFDWDWPAVESELKRALELDPNYVAAHHWYSHYLVLMDQMEMSEAISKRALELDPLDLEINAHLAWHYYSAGDFDAAEKQALKTIEMDANFHEAHWFLGCVYMHLKKYDEAAAEFSKAVTCSGSSPRMLAELGSAYGYMGKTGEARRILDRLNELALTTYVAPYNFALLYTGLGDLEKALDWLESSRDDRNSLLIYLRTEHQFAPLRSDSRFGEIVRSIGLF